VIAFTTRRTAGMSCRELFTIKKKKEKKKVVCLRSTVKFHDRTLSIQGRSTLSEPEAGCRASIFAALYVGGNPEFSTNFWLELTGPVGLLIRKST